MKKRVRPFAHVDRILGELAESHKETERLIKETQAETDRQIKETQAKTDRQIKETQTETDHLIKEMQAKTDRQINHLRKMMGSVNDNIGFGAETCFQTALAKTMQFAGITFEEMYPSLKKCRQGRNCEFDAVLVNHNDVAIVDVKHRVHRNQVREIATDKVQLFREFFPQYKDYNLYLGLAGLSTEEGVEEEAREYGVGILKQNGDAIETLGLPLKAY